MSCETPVASKKLVTWLAKDAIAWGPSRGLEDRIRALCVRVIDSAEDQIEPFMRELRLALREHNDRLRRFAAAELTRPRPHQDANSS